MKIALLSVIETASAEPSGLRACLPIGGRSVVRHQLGLALALGCTRIIVVAEAMSGELVALQEVAEAGGARFHVVSTPRALAPLVSPADEVIVLSDGLLAMPDDAMALLAQGSAVLTLPVETGLSAGFERIDINHASAGAMRIPGRVAAGLAELPAEWNPASALLRLAGQAHIPQRALPASLVEAGRWGLVRSEEDARRIEPLWLRLHTTGMSRRAPGEMAAALTVQAFGPALLHAGTRPLVIALAALAVLLLGMGAGAVGAFAVGFLMVGVAWYVHLCAALVARIERDSLLAGRSEGVLAQAFGWAIDIALVTLAAWRSEMPDVAGVPTGARWFAPLMVFLLLHVAADLSAGRRWAPWLADRLVAGIVLAMASALLPFDSFLQAVAGALGAACVALQYVRRRTDNHGLRHPV